MFADDANHSAFGSNNVSYMTKRLQATVYSKDTGPRLDWKVDQAIVNCSCKDTTMRVPRSQH